MKGRFSTWFLLSRLLLLMTFTFTSISLSGAAVTHNIPSPHLRTPRDYFPIPAAAFVQGLGTIPQNPASSHVQGQHYQAGRGISLGGIGAGSFMYNQAGMFGPWDFRNPIHAEHVLSQAAFHIREQLGGSSATVTTLATMHPLGNVLPAWHRLSPGDGEYAALYPFGWTTYNPFSSDISMRFWSPIVAQDDQHSSLPIAYFDARLANHTSSADILSMMFTFPNTQACWLKTCPTRTGFYSNEQSNAQTGVTGITLGASDPSNEIDLQNTEWSIAALPQQGQTVSYTTSWNANGDGSDIYNQFSINGNLNDGSIDGSNSAGAIAVSTTLQPGQVTTVSFALAWDFPMTLFGNPSGQHTLWMKRYTSYFGTKETTNNNYIPGSYPFHQGFTIADTALSDESNALNLVTNWWSTVANEQTYPLWLRQTALNELYYDTVGDAFWESGLVENTYPLQYKGPRVGAQVPGTHLFFNAENPLYTFAESYDVRAYENRQWLLLFPDIERDVQRAWTQFMLEDPHGHAPHDAGIDHLSPYIVWPGDTYGNPNNWLDLPIKYLFQAWEYIHFTGDNQFLRYAYAAMLKSYHFVANGIPKGQYLPVDNGIDNTYDTWHLDGNTSYIGGLWILGEEVMLVATQQALAMGIKGASQQLIDTLNANLPNARSQFESVLWNASQGYYQISTQDQEYGTGVMADGMFAQHVAEVLGLPNIVGDPNHLHTHLLTSYNYLVAPWHDQQGNGIGAANGVDANGGIIQHGCPGLPPGAICAAQEIWSGVSYFYAATQYLDGVRFQDTTLQQNGLNTALGIAQQTYTVTQNGYYFDTPEAWLIQDVTQARALQYMRPRAIWELLLALKQPLPWATGSFSSVSDAWNNPGISDDSNPAAANLDAAGYTYSAQTLASAGLTPGAIITHNGVTFTWPDIPSAALDNVAAAGQTINISGSGSKLAFLGSSTFGPATGVGVITYSDGTQQMFTLALSDWTLDGNTVKLLPGNDTIATLPYVNHPPGKAGYQGYVFYVAVGLVQGKQVQSVTLPFIIGTKSGYPISFHLFAMAIA